MPVLEAELREIRAAVVVLLERIDRALSRDVESMPPVAAEAAEDDLAPEHLLEISTAVERFNRPADTIRYWCRREGCGVKVGGRWMASVRRIERRLNGA
jgi:hypothetical protein